MNNLSAMVCGFLCFFAQVSFGQNNLIVHSEGGKIYLVHLVVAKENWYSVGRIYNISPREMAPFNGLTIDRPLSIGQELKIPLNTVNFTQDGKKNPDEKLIPVYHAMQPSELLSHVSSSYKVPVETLERWNRINKTGPVESQQLVIGYLKVKTALSYLATEGSKAPESDPLSSAAKGTGAGEKPDATISQTQPEARTTVNGNTSTSYHPGPGTGGFFSHEYSEGSNKMIGTAGTFKSTSGWNDGKYYILIDHVAVGTIVKVIAPATQKSVYAKVLGQLPEMKESEGLLVRISNSAASELGEPEGKFGVQVRY